MIILWFTNLPEAPLWMSGYKYNLSSCLGMKVTRSQWGSQTPKGWENCSTNPGIMSFLEVGGKKPWVEKQLILLPVLKSPKKCQLSLCPPHSPFLFSISHGIRREHLDILHHVKKCTRRSNGELQEIFWLRFYSLKYQVKCDIVLNVFFCPWKLPLFYTQAWLL